MYFAGMFRVADAEFVPEYRQEESREFVSMATKIQHVVGVDVASRRRRQVLPLVMAAPRLGQFCVQDVLCGPTLQAGRHL